MTTVWTAAGAAALFLLAFALTVVGGSKKKRFIVGGLGGVSLLLALNLSAGLTGISVGLNAISIAASFLLGVPGAFAVLTAGIIT